MNHYHLPEKFSSILFWVFKYSFSTASVFTQFNQYNIDHVTVVVEAVGKALRVASVVDLGDADKTLESKRNPGGENGYDNNKFSDSDDSLH